MRCTSDATIAKQVQHANDRQRPLYLLIAATRPCFIKLASLVRALERRQMPHLLLTSGQHWDSDLTGPLKELRYSDRVSVSLRASGPMLKRQGELADGLLGLSRLLKTHKLEQPAVPIVSGDTWSAAFVPANWLMHTGTRSVHIEAGLRSEGPEWETLPEGPERITRQRECPWRLFQDDPFPEGICTRMATIASRTLLAPIRRNAAHLLAEQCEEKAITVVGSLSADAVHDSYRDEAGLDAALEALFQEHPQLSSGEWLRVDVHRRENMRPDRLAALLCALSDLSKAGVNVTLVETNAFRGAIQQHRLAGQLQEAAQAGVLITPMWKRYLSVLAFMRSDRCLGLYTDSGGLQEEAHVMGVTCMTARWSTDRAETVLEAGSNVLIPLDSSCEVSSAIQAYRIMQADKPRQPGTLYGEEVGNRIVDALVAAETAGVDYWAHHGALDWS